MTVIFGYAVMAAAAFGILRVLWRWRTARRAEQALVIAMAANFMVYMLSTLVSSGSPHDLIAMLPFGGVLAARALVPERIASRLVAVPATCLALVAALLPLSVAASQPTPTSALSPVIAWLQANGLHYGLGGYWDSSETALESADQVQIRAVDGRHTVHGNRDLPLSLGDQHALVRPRQALRELRHPGLAAAQPPPDRPGGVRQAGPHAHHLEL